MDRRGARTAWGIDLGHAALKAVRLRQSGDRVEVEAFDVIEHDLAPGATEDDRQSAMAWTLGLFLTRERLAGARVAVSVGGRTASCHFTHLPPVDGEQIPELVGFEAAQQVPYPIEQAVWRWQTFRDPDRPDSPDVDAGIFALRRADVGASLLLFAQAGVDVDVMQAAPLALVNFLAFDRPPAGRDATLIVDVGAAETNVVAAGDRWIWTRAIDRGSAGLTETLAPACDELIGLIAQAVADGAAAYPRARPGRLIGAGGGFALAGLADRLSRALGLPVAALAGFERIGVAASQDASAVAARAGTLAVACGLALQGLGLATVHANFLPSGIARKWAWPGARPLRAVGRLLRGLLRRRRLGRGQPPGEDSA